MQGNTPKLVIKITSKVSLFYLFPKRCWYRNKLSGVRRQTPRTHPPKVVSGRRSGPGAPPTSSSKPFLFHRRLPSPPLFRCRLRRLPPPPSRFRRRHRHRHRCPPATRPYRIGLPWHRARAAPSSSSPLYILKKKRSDFSTSSSSIAARCRQVFAGAPDE